MKKIVLMLNLVLMHSALFSQGLKDIIVETYYVTDISDTMKWGADKIGINTVTYRIFVSMEEGYSLHSVFGAPGHPLILSTSSKFFNHGVHGKYLANMLWPQLLNDGLLILDSWISMGAGCQGKYAVLKTDDDTVRNVQNTSRPAILQSENKIAGVPLKYRDGLLACDSLPAKVTQVGLDSLLMNIAKIPTSDGFVFETTNGGWGCLGGAKGFRDDKNYVCIGQFTTDGDFYFEFNIQIGSAEHGVEQYVAVDPVGGEKLHTGLIISKQAIGKHEN